MRKRTTPIEAFDHGFLTQENADTLPILSTKAPQDVLIHACVGVEVIPQGPPDGDHMANGRVEMAVREVKRQCRTLRIPLMTVRYPVGFTVLQLM